MFNMDRQFTYESCSCLGLKVNVTPDAEGGQFGPGLDVDSGRVYQTAGHPVLTRPCYKEIVWHDRNYVFVYQTRPLPQITGFSNMEMQKIKQPFWSPPPYGVFCIIVLLLLYIHSRPIPLTVRGTGEVVAGADVGAVARAVRRQVTIAVHITLPLPGTGPTLTRHATRTPRRPRLPVARNCKNGTIIIILYAWTFSIDGCKWPSVRVRMKICKTTQVYDDMVVMLSNIRHSNMYMSMQIIVIVPII